VFCSLLFMVCGCLLLWWSSFLRQDDKFGGRLFVVCICLLSWRSSFLRQDDKFGGRLERSVGIENWSRRLEVMCDCVL
jgi:hypothetical protein